jgi:ABC-type phosphonate transport system ATPase subunit
MGAGKTTVGRELAAFFHKDQTQKGELLLSVRGLGREGAFTNVSFEIHRGEVLGFAGLVGARRTDVGLAIFDSGDPDYRMYSGKHVRHGIVECPVLTFSDWRVAGTVDLNKDGKTVDIRHEAIPDYMPAMTMPFEARVRKPSK